MSPQILGKWQNVLFSLSETLLVSYSVIQRSAKYIFLQFFDSLDIKFLQMAEIEHLGPHPPRQIRKIEDLRVEIFKFRKKRVKVH